MKYSPAPWNAVLQDQDLSEAWYDIRSAHGSVAHLNEGARTDEGLRFLKADALLIAAAPDLYEALSALYIETYDCERLNNLGDPDDSYAVRLAKAALAKAEGKR